MGMFHLRVHINCGTQLWINTPAKLRSTDRDGKSYLFQADEHHPQRLPACVVGILEDHLQGSPSDQSVKIQYRRLPVKPPHFFDKCAVTWCTMRIGHLDNLSVHKIATITDSNAANAPWVVASQRDTGNISKTAWKSRPPKTTYFMTKPKGLSWRHDWTGKC
jgi:hypothetical protein